MGRRPDNEKPMDFSAIKEQLRADLKPSRYLHTEGVTYTAAALAMRYGVDLDRAMLAGWLHDCAKCLPDEESKALIYSQNEEVTLFEEKNPQLLHAKAGAILAKVKYEVTDEAVLHAIRVHTTGCPGMTLLDKIVFIADFIEPGRYVAPHLAELRQLAFTNLNACLVRILEDTLDYLEKSGKEIDPTTRDTYLYYQDAGVDDTSNEGGNK